MTEKVTGTIYKKVRFEAMLRNHKTGEIDLEDVFVQFPLSVIYEANGEEKTTPETDMTEQELWNAAIARVQCMTAYGTIGEAIALRKKETTLEKKMRAETQRSIFEEIRDQKDELNDALRNEAAERYDNMIR